MALIYHITDMPQWQDALNRGAVRPPSLKAEGFIHFSTAAQLAATVQRHFPHLEELVVLHVPEARVQQHLRYEPATGGELFPHLYAALPLTAITDVSIVLREADGGLDWPPGLLTD